MIIEDMAEVSDDEEKCGDFQYQRIDAARVATGGSWFDEYQTVRKTKKEVGVEWER